MKTKTDLNGPENSDRKASKRADHGPKNSDTYSYQVGGDDAPWGKANDTALSPMDWATPEGDRGNENGEDNNPSLLELTGGLNLQIIHIHNGLRSSIGIFIDEDL